MAFRAYFYEPFNIPTGSMQPTLYGNHSISCSPKEADFFDKTPLKWLKWIATGEMYEHFQAPFGGTLQFRPTNTGHYDMRVVNGLTGRTSKQMLVPTDVLHPHETGDGPYRQQTFALPNGLTHGSAVSAGQSLWSGKVVTGDFLFVNRWLWNFRHPRRGDVMIFSTTGIAGLQQGTHYIKRLTATPGDTLEIKDAAVYIDGERQPSLKPETGAAGEASPRYDAGPMTGPVTLGADEYFACGDNSYPAQMSFDSRYWGMVPGTKLRGVAACVFWPIVNPRIGRIK